MIFAAPQLLWLLLIIVPALVLFLWWAWRKRQQLITQFISARLLGHLKVGVSPSRQQARMAILVAAVIFLVLAMARPQWGVIREEAHQRGLDIMLAIDTSNSMLAEDVSPNRLARAKLAALDLMHRAKTDRVGLIAFAGAAFLQCPLTLDEAAFSQSVNALDTRTISQGGTAIAEAIDEARKSLTKEGDNHKVLVVFTDGEDHDSDAVAAAQKAAKEGMLIFTIGIGTPEGELLRVRNDRGELDYIRDDQNQPVKSHLDEELLQQIAQATKGFYLPLRGTKTMDTLYDRGIAPLPKMETSMRMYQHRREQFQWPLAVAIILLVLELFLPDRRRRRSTKGAAPNSLAAAMTETTVVLLLLALPMTAFASPSSALREYQAGNYEKSLSDYDKLLQGKKDDPRLHFNAGAAAYQSHQLDTAEKEFTGALESPDLQLQQRAYYNLGNTLYRQGQQNPDTSKREEIWKRAVEQYESASKLNQQDPDAKYNHEFVTKQLEELKKQQQQQQQKQDQKSDKDKKDQKNQDSQSGQDGQNGKKNEDQKQDKKDAQKNQDKNSQADKSQDQKSDQQKEEEKKQEEQAKQEQADRDKDKDKQVEADQAKEKSAEEAKREAKMMAAGQMTPRQAQQLLDAQKNDEQVFQFAPTNKNTLQSRVYKNW